jgi:hypothetical protein
MTLLIYQHLSRNLKFRLLAQWNREFGDSSESTVDSLFENSDGEEPIVGGLSLMNNNENISREETPPDCQKIGWMSWRHRIYLISQKWFLKNLQRKL